MKDFNMQMKTTKCLNTAVMLTFILGGSEKLKTVRYCDVPKITSRYDKQKNKLGYKKRIFQEFKKDISKTNIKKRYFYYILMSNTNMEKSELTNNKELTQSFPGHVFIIDKIPNCENKNEPNFNIYQSYINQYDLKGHYKKNENSMKLKNNNINYLLNGINNIIDNEVWNNEAVKFWNELTFVDTTNLLTYKTENINLCYSKISIDDCYDELYRFTYNKALILYNDLYKNNNVNLKEYNMYSDKNDFYVEQLTPINLYLKLRDLVIELEEKIINNK